MSVLGFTSCGGPRPAFEGETATAGFGASASVGGVLDPSPGLAVLFADEGLRDPTLETWRKGMCTAPNLQQLAPRFAWGISRGFVFDGLQHFTDLAKPLATQVASKVPLEFFRFHVILQLERVGSGRMATLISSSVLLPGS